jgi:hypothetical protein
MCRSRLRQNRRTMKYMLLIYGEEKLLTQAEREACYQESVAYTHRLKEKGQYVSASPLQLVASASSVRVREGRAMVTDGPFAETHEQLGGYYIVDVPDQASAIEAAQGIPGAKWGTVEVRPLIDLPNLPE